MNVISRLKFSIASLLLLTAGIAVCASWVSSRATQVNIEKQVLADLIKNDVEIGETIPPKNLIEKLLGQQLQLSQYNVRLRYNQNQHLYDLTKLTHLEELTISLHGNLVNLMQFSDFPNLKRLWVHEWYSPLTMDGVQSLTNLEYLEIGNVEDPDAIDLTPLADHPSLEEFRINGRALEKSNGFQALPDW